MDKSLQNMIDRYKNGLLETQNLQISNENFSDETICNEFLFRSSFKNLSLINLNFTNVNFESSFLTNACLKTAFLTVHKHHRKKATRYFRIYEKFRSLRFELELRKKLYTPHQNFFFSHSFKEFEDGLVNVFYDEFSNLCILDSIYSF